MPEPDEVRVVVRNQRQHIILRYGRYDSRPYRLMDGESAERAAKRVARWMRWDKGLGPERYLPKEVRDGGDQP